MHWNLLEYQCPLINCSLVHAEKSHLKNFPSQELRSRLYIKTIGLNFILLGVAFYTVVLTFAHNYSVIRGGSGAVTVTIVSQIHTI